MKKEFLNTEIIFSLGAESGCCWNGFRQTETWAGSGRLDGSGLAHARLKGRGGWHLGRKGDEANAGQYWESGHLAWAEVLCFNAIVVLGDFWDFFLGYKKADELVEISIYFFEQNLVSYCHKMDLNEFTQPYTKRLGNIKMFSFYLIE